MLDAVRRYATKILLVHLVLLVLVIFFVLGAAREVQQSARDQAQQQSKERLELLAEQTARGLKSHYTTIMSDLDVILREDTATTAAGATSLPAAIPATQPADAFTYLDRGGRGGRGARGSATQPGGRFAGQGGQNGQGAGRNFGRGSPGQLVVNERTLSQLWRQVKGRVSQLIWVNTDEGGGQRYRIQGTFPATSEKAAAALVEENLDWLKTVKEPEMSRFKIIPGTTAGETTGYHLIAMPAQAPGGPNGGGNPTGNPNAPGGGFGGRGGGGPGGPGGPGDPNFRGGGPGRGGPFGPEGEPPPGPNGQPPMPPREPPHTLVVAVVPIDNVGDLFLDHLNEQEAHEVSALLVNDAGDILLSSSLNAVGTNLPSQLDGELRGKLAPLIGTEKPSSVVFEKAFTIGDARIAPQIFAAARLDIPSGPHWTVLIGSPLADAELLVNHVFRSAVIWAFFVSITITGILVSTSVFMIRGRVRLERTRHEMLTRELEQARHIQLAWLPDMKSVPAGLDVSAANLPANHISGDFYNWFSLPRRGHAANADLQDAAPPKIGIVIGDVTGHGMAAAFLMATTQLLVRMTLTRSHDPARCLREVNEQLCAQAGSGFQGQFVTMLVMVFDPVNNTIEVSSAGHPLPLIETNGHFESLALESHLVLGVDPDEEYRAETFPLEPGASVLLYTDGVVEAEAPTGRQYGVDNLIALMKSKLQPDTDVEPADCVRAVLDDVKRFCGTREVLDDITLVAVRTSPAAVPAQPVA